MRISPYMLFQARGLDGNIIKDQPFEDMVEAYVAELRSLQPEGPIFWAAIAWGGLLALEAAHQLSALGETVAFGCADPNDPPHLRSLSPRSQRAAAGAGIVRRSASTWSPAYLRYRGVKPHR